MAQRIIQLQRSTHMGIHMRRCTDYDAQNKKKKKSAAHETKKKKAFKNVKIPKPYAFQDPNK